LRHICVALVSSGALRAFHVHAADVAVP
jgi:hypothetical protein